MGMVMGMQQFRKSCGVCVCVCIIIRQLHKIVENLLLRHTSMSLTVEWENTVEKEHCLFVSVCV